MRIRQWLAIAPVVCALTLFGTACGGDDGGALEQVASLGDDSGTTDETGDDNDSPDAEPLSEEERQQAHLDFAKCMREHGIDMPDPQFDGGRVTQSMEAPKDQAAFEAAMEACADENGGGAFSAGPGAGTRTEATK